jgi:hypothetical protein
MVLTFKRGSLANRVGRSFLALLMMHDMCSRYTGDKSIFSCYLHVI